MGIARAAKTDADIVLGTDPDCDRVGVAVKVSDGEYRLLTGNQIGALLMDFVLRHTELPRYKRPAAVKTVVTSELGADIARKYGLSVFSTLTGFKFVGEKITQFEQAKKNGNDLRDYDFIFGYEESYGYLAGTHARDKDAVVSSMLICEMAAEAKAGGKTFIDKINDIYSGKVLMEGYPRNDVFFDENQRNKVKSELNLNDKEVLVYMPTYKGSYHDLQNKKQITDLKRFFKKLDTQRDWSANLYNFPDISHHTNIVF